jgi:hypothetical protein
MDPAETAAYSVDSVEAALQLVIQIESSEINEVFQAALAATDVAFVKRLKPFRAAMMSHMSYISKRLPKLAPGLELACRRLRDNSLGRDTIEPSLSTQTPPTDERHQDEDKRGLKLFRPHTDSTKRTA